MKEKVITAIVSAFLILLALQILYGGDVTISLTELS